MGIVESQNLDGDTTVELDPEATVRLASLVADVRLDEYDASPTVERRTERTQEELEAALRLLTPPVPPVNLPPESPPSLACSSPADVAPFEVVPASPRKAGPGLGRDLILLARDVMLFVRDAILLFLRDARVVLRPAFARFVAASRRTAVSVTQWASGLSQTIVWRWAGGPRPRRLERSKVFHARMSEGEIAILHAIADSWGVPASNVVRTLVLRECTKLDIGVGRRRSPEWSAIPVE